MKEWSFGYSKNKFTVNIRNSRNATWNPKPTDAHSAGQLQSPSAKLLKGLQHSW